MQELFILCIKLILVNVIIKITILPELFLLDERKLSIYLISKMRVIYVLNWLWINELLDDLI